MHAVFDIGNVLVHIDFEQFIRTLTHQFNAFSDTEKTTQYLNRIERLDYCGLISREECYRNDFALSDIETERLMIIWNLILVRNNQMINFIQKLKDQNVKIALLSNIAKEHHKYLTQICPELFDKTILHFSYEVGIAKPSKLYYQSFLMSNPDFAGAIYLDDVKENLTAGSQTKFESIEFNLHNLTKNQNPSVLKKKLDELYNKIIL